MIWSYLQIWCPNTHEREARELDKKYIETIGEAKWRISEVTVNGKLNKYKRFKTMVMQGKVFLRATIPFKSSLSTMWNMIYIIVPV